MLGRQLDLFSATGLPAADGTAAHVEPSRLVPSNLDDSELVEALPEVRVVDCHALCAEAGRRRLIAAIPALEALCRRFKGFGLEHAVPEQIAALRGLAAISTREAAAAVSRIIAENVVQGPGLHDAVQCRGPPRMSPAARGLVAPSTAQRCTGSRRHLSRRPTTCRRNARAGRLAG